MSRVRARGEQIRRSILENVESHPTDVGRRMAERFGITRQGVNKHLQRLVTEGSLTETGRTRNRSYSLSPLVEWTREYHFTPELAEDVVWRDDIRKAFGHLPENVMDIWQHGFTEMFNNARDHSVGTNVLVLIRKTAVATEMALIDDGMGIFRKLQHEMRLLDERHAILELAKGKLTTDPMRHSGEGIFFTSRMFDSFDILSSGVFYSHKFDEADDWIMERTKPGDGTAVWLKLSHHTSRTPKKVFDQFTSGEDFGFTKTIVPVSLAQYGNDKLISRSQAKRLVARVELFKTVVFDFSNVPTIGHAFADEVFRVFTTQHPEIHVIATNTHSEVKRMIHRAQSGHTDLTNDNGEEAKS